MALKRICGLADNPFEIFRLGKDVYVQMFIVTEESSEHLSPVHLVN